jgi:hypothetical protein
MNPGGTMRIPNVAVWLLFDQVHILREKYVATASRCDNVFSNVFVTYGYGLDVNIKAQTQFVRPLNEFQNTVYARRCDNVFSNVFVTYGYGLDVNVKTLLRYISEYAIYLTT